MAWPQTRDARPPGRRLLLQVFLLVQDFVPQITVISIRVRRWLFFFVVVGDDIQMHRMDLHNFELSFAFRAIQNLALFHFILIEIDLDGAFRATHHSRTSWPSMALSRKRIIFRGRVKGGDPESMTGREFPEFPLVGVGGVVIDQDRALLVRRAREPALGEWTIPGGLLEVGETLTAAVEREILEETGLTVRVLELIEALERIFSDSEEIHPGVAMGRIAGSKVASRISRVQARPRFHYVILDYLCEPVSGEATIHEEISDLAFVREKELEKYALTPAATRVLHKAFAMSRCRHGAA
jgi:8-oxo-dGTP diphosphatase